MPMLADLDDPPAPRWRFMLIGIGIAAVVVSAVAYFVMPAVHSSIVGESREYDARLRQEDAYMKSVCGDALVIERDEGLCKCALAAEYPSLDCRSPFMAWTLDRQAQQCADGEPEAAPAFCACVAEKKNELAPLSNDTDDKLRRAVIARYSECTELPDALHLPSIESLMPPASAGTTDPG